MDKIKTTEQLQKPVPEYSRKLKKHATLEN
jgi:hypothetical protein